MTTETSYTRHGPKADEAAERIIEREILACQSSLVIDMLARSETKSAVDGFNHDDVENLYPDPSEWTAEECIAWFDDMGGAPCDDTIHAEDVEAWREHVRDNAEPVEIYEWWLVTPWLCAKLREAGEPVLDNNYGTWWGRTCTGQSIIIDGTIQEIAVKAWMVG